MEKAEGGVYDPALARAGDQVGQRDLVRSDVQPRGGVHSVNPEVFNGVAGVDHLGLAIQHVLIAPGALAVDRKINASPSEAVDQAECRHLRQIYGAVCRQLSTVDAQSG